MGFLPNGRGGGEGRGRRPTNNVWVRLGGPTKERNQNDVRKDTLCKFWATGRCFKGNRCPYMHSQSHDTKIAHSSERDKLKSDDNKKEMPICKLIAPLQRHTGFNVCEQADTDIAYPPAGDEPKTDNNMEMLCNVSIIATLQGHTKPEVPDPKIGCARIARPEARIFEFFEFCPNFSRLPDLPDPPEVPELPEYG
ncbi:hypothetical protein L484_012172 [Morus notabilis]|uniref:C3H1-type domain-containing protein n=1 Tax=Morus notabilis TaxID=981085 RepID=W9R7J2_9ROSA|nr:hypothetical protein L484_012172 [Morus notabilis]